jgi:hypothetical protein
MNHKHVSLKTHCGQTPHHNLLPNAQRQNHRLRPNVHLNTPRGLMAHLLNLWKPATSKKKRRRKQEFRIPEPDNATPTMHPTPDLWIGIPGAGIQEKNGRKTAPHHLRHNTWRLFHSLLNH